MASGLSALQVGDGFFRLGDGGPKLGLAGTVAIDDSAGELPHPAVDLFEEATALRRLVDLVGGDKTNADADDEHREILHACLLATFRGGWRRTGERAGHIPASLPGRRKRAATGDPLPTDSR